LVSGSPTKDDSSCDDKGTNHTPSKQKDDTSTNGPKRIDFGGLVCRFLQNIQDSLQRHPFWLNTRFVEGDEGLERHSLVPSRQTFNGDFVGQKRVPHCGSVHIPPTSDLAYEANLVTTAACALQRVHDTSKFDDLIIGEL